MRDPNKPYFHDKVLAATILRLIPWTVHPNHITVLRFLLTPFVFALIGSGNYGWGVPVFLFTAATDALDGSLARVRGQVTRWGTVYDPLADKILIGGLVFLVVFEHINFWLGLSIIALESVFIIAGYFRMKKGIIQPANVWGKIKMLFEVMGVSMLLLALWGDVQFFMNVSFATFALAIVFALLSLASHGT
ncbi:CDP-alcohol phosphatidyltransferase family protein [Candidatus Uhrbacteria bacterium]|nr:CDP-alcohol phosphatidyltransferase family protein [Candidatus Uhrbacteria bacterium]